MFNFLRKKVTLVTHDGAFHADDIFACAVLQLWLDKHNKRYQVVRTRDESLIQKADFVFDVGAIYNHDNRRYDHHQKEGAGVRANGISYAAFGLTWKHYGPDLCGSEEVASMIDTSFVQIIDAGDVAYTLFTPILKDIDHPLEPNYIFAYFHSIWNESAYDIDGAFGELVEFAKKLLVRAIAKKQAWCVAQEFIQHAYTQSNDKRLLVLPERWPWSDFVKNHPEILYVIYPNNNRWWANTTEEKRFEPRKRFPQAWGGLRDEELSKVTGVADSVFCHLSGFLCVAKSKEGAIALAEKSLQE